MLTRDNLVFEPMVSQPLIEIYNQTYYITFHLLFHVNILLGTLIIMDKSHDKSATAPVSLLPVFKPGLFLT